MLHRVTLGITALAVALGVILTNVLFLYMAVGCMEMGGSVGLGAGLACVMCLLAFDVGLAELWNAHRGV